MAKVSEATHTCESCEEQDATTRHSDLGWVCEDCLESYKDMNDDETSLTALSDDEIEALAKLDEKGDLYEDEEDLTDEELEREGFSLEENEDEADD